MRLALGTLALLVACGGAHEAPTPLGNLAPWSLARWFGQCSKPIQVSEEGITSRFACKDHPGAASWTIEVHYAGQIIQFAVAGRDKSELQQTFAARADKLVGNFVAARLAPTLVSDESRVDDDIRISRLSTPGGLIASTEQVRWTTEARTTD